MKHCSRFCAILTRILLFLRWGLLWSGIWSSYKYTCFPGEDCWGGWGGVRGKRQAKGEDQVKHWFQREVRQCLDKGSMRYDEAMFGNRLSFNTSE